MDRVKTRNEASIALDRICMLECVLLVEIQTLSRSCVDSTNTVREYV